jgi:alanine racemase
MLYGASPMPGHQSADALGLKPVMTLTSEIIGIQHLQAGDRVGYGGTFTAPEAMTVGVVACGYADGYPRHAPTGTPVQVNGQRTRTLGRVSMDKLCVDLTGLKVGAGGTVVPVTLWGEGLPADEVAAAAGTIAYELFCALAGRVDIEYVG